jgi:hypothetical protein
LGGLGEATSAKPVFSPTHTRTPLITVEHSDDDPSTPTDTMAPPRVQQQQYAPPLQPLPSGVEGEDQLSTAYSLLLLSEYNHTLDSLPLDLSRNFADLRELDAVLSSSMQSITTKIAALTTMIEEGTVPKDQRLWLLHDIAEEAGRLKLGGEDKIRVACQAADNLRAHNTHLRTLTDTLPGFDTSVLIRKTQYPHVSPQSFMPVHTTEHGRRRRNQHGSLLTINQSTTDPSPAKRKRVVNAREEDIDIGSIKSPRKEQATTTGRGRVNNRVKKCVLPCSPFCRPGVLTRRRHPPPHPHQPPLPISQGKRTRHFPRRICPLSKLSPKLWHWPNNRLNLKSRGLCKYQQTKNWREQPQWHTPGIHEF